MYLQLVFNALGFDEELVFRSDREPAGFFQKLVGKKGEPPKIFIAGAQKSGTTSLFAYLTEHPQLIAPRLKEPFFFGNDDRFSKGLDFYLPNFPVAEDRHTSIDASTNYLDHPKAAERIKQCVPDAKIIILLRNPVDRAWSHYQMARRNKVEDLSFEKALELEEKRIASGENRAHNYCYQRLGYRARGEYARMLPSWMNAFDATQLRVVCAEDFFRDTKKIYGELLDFLELAQHQPEKFETLNSGNPAETDPATRSRLLAYYNPWNEKLEKLLNREFHWE